MLFRSRAAKAQADENAHAKTPRSVAVYQDENASVRTPAPPTFRDENVRTPAPINNENAGARTAKENATPGAAKARHKYNELCEHALTDVVVPDIRRYVCFNTSRPDIQLAARVSSCALI